MANITIKEILASDKISELVDKVNFNFDQLLLNGGGPIGLPGGPGGPGPTGPRGSIWFTVADLMTTSNSPSWTGSPVNINDINLPNYPQYKGDPNRFLPVAPIGATPILPWIFPENTFTFNSTLKVLRSFDLFVQEGDDTFNSYSSKDGDLWQYSSISNSWSFTGVNIKGEAGSVGNDATDEWVRVNSGQDDILYPNHITSQNAARVLIGSYNLPFDATHPSASLTLVPNIDLPGPQLAIGHPSIHDGIGNTLMPTISVTSLGELVINGSQNGTGKQIIVTSFDSNIILNSGGVNSTGYQQRPISAEHYFIGGYLRVTGIPSAVAENYLMNQAGIKFGITLDAATGVRINTDTGTNLILQADILKNVGIGQGFTSLIQPLSKLAISSNVSIGNAYKDIAAPLNGLAIEGSTGIGVIGTGIKNKLEVNGSIDIYPDNFYGFNTYYSLTPSANYYRTDVGYSSFMKQDPSGKWGLYVSPATGAADSTISASSAITILNSTRFIGLNTDTPTRRLTIFDGTSSGIHLINNTLHGASNGSHIYVEKALPISGLFPYQLNIRNQENAEILLSTNNIIRQTIVKDGHVLIGANSWKSTAWNTGRLSVHDIDHDLDASDPDKVTMGTMGDALVYVATEVWALNSVIPTYTQNSGGGSYIAFNGHVNGTAAVPAAVINESEADNGYTAGAFIWMDKFGNLHFVIDHSVSGGPLIPR